jgi:hypothetical protein
MREAWPWRRSAIGLAVSLAATIASVAIVNFWGYAVPGLLTVLLPAALGGLGAGLALRHGSDLRVVGAVSAVTALVIVTLAGVTAFNRGFPVHVTSLAISFVLFAVLHGGVAWAIVSIVRGGDEGPLAAR